MNQNTEPLTLALIQSAQAGDEQSQSRLTQVLHPKVYAYVYRLTLDVHLAEDICQETMIRLLQNLPQLSFETPRFLWAWLYKTALNLIREHYNRQVTRQEATQGLEKHMAPLMDEKQKHSPGPDNAMHQELLVAVTQALNALKLQYRNILILRCFQELSYADIAKTIGNTELGARLLFYRAKQSLSRQLAKDGFKKSQLLPGLSLFATATLAPTEKVTTATVSSVVMQTGMAPPLLATLVTTKLGLTFLVVTLLSFATISTHWLLPNEPQSHTTAPIDVLANDVVLPTRIQAVSDTNPNRWLGAVVNHQSHDLSPLPPQQWLTRTMGPRASWILLPEKHWIDVSFDQPLIDGEGNDIFIVEACCHGEQAKLYLTDDQNNRHPLGTLNIPRTDLHGIYIYGFDLGSVSPPFTPTGLRIETTKAGLSELPNNPTGLELQQIRARVQAKPD